MKSHSPWARRRNPPPPPQWGILGTCIVSKHSPRVFQISPAYGNCARGTSGSQNRGVLSAFCVWVLVSGYGSECYN